MTDEDGDGYALEGADCKYEALIYQAAVARRPLTAVASTTRRGKCLDIDTMA